MDRLLASRQSLAEALRAHGVVPVIGPEALVVDVADSAPGRCTVPFYRLVADALLETYDTMLPDNTGTGTGSSWLLHRAVAQVLADRPGTSTERVRRSVAAIVVETSARVRAAPLLDRLARLRAFDLYVCLTPDDLLVDALRRVVGEQAIDIGVHAPSNDSSQAADIAAARADRVRVHFPLGRIASGARPALHEEDALEYLFRFQENASQRLPHLLETLHRRDLLLLGCNLPDWLELGFIRLANKMRLSSQDKKMEFFAADTGSPGLSPFLARFNPNATVFPWTPEEFVAELESLTGRTGADSAPAIPTTPPARPGMAQGPTAFVSYASEDRVAAREIAAALVDAGFADVWFDRHKLIAGDDWSDRIDDAIEHCDFFIPVLSRQADGRREGVFWEEWRKAVARAMRVHDAFLIPVGIDPLAPDRAGYERIFNGFTSDLKRLHLVHAPAGRLDADMAGQLRARVAVFQGRGGG